jgi:DNA-3-methyladenine glycosylase II
MKAKRTLTRDPVMKGLVEKYGALGLTESTDYFADLARAIVAQQLATKAADTIWRRVTALLGGEVTAGKFLSIAGEAVRQAGVSANKLKYMTNLAQAVMDGTLDLENIQNRDDEEIIPHLSAIKGIGRWTAEMFLIFSLAREDVFSFGDGGLKSALNKLYGGGGVLTKGEMESITDKWRPYRSLASLYLWRSLDNKKDNK